MLRSEKAAYGCSFGPAGSAPRSEATALADIARRQVRRMASTSASPQPCPAGPRSKGLAALVPARAGPTLFVKQPRPSGRDWAAQARLTGSARLRNLPTAAGVGGLASVMKGSDRR